MAEPAADSTVGSAAALTSLLNSLEGTLSGPYYIDLEDGAYGSMTFDQVFAHPVYVRSQDRVGLGAKFTGITMQGAENLNFRFVMEDRTGLSVGLGHVQFDAAVDCGIYLSVILGDTSDSSYVPPSYGVYYRNGATRCTVADCYLSHWRKAVYALSCSDVYLLRNTFNYIGGDEMHFSSCNGIDIIDNWGSRIKVPSDGEHMDFVQFSSLGASSNVTIRGNVFLLADAAQTSVAQFIFGGADLTTVLVEQNICLTNTSAGVNLDGTSLSGVTSRLNTLLYLIDSAQPDLFTCVSSITSGTNADNVVAAANGTGGGSGGGGIAIDVGPNKDNRDYSDYALYFDAPLDSGATMGDYIPKVGTRMHWDDADPTGAYERFQEIHVQGLHPGNVEGPAKAYWDALYNADAALTSGSTDALGGGTITSAASLSGGGIGQTHAVAGGTLTAASTMDGGDIGAPSRALISWAEIEYAVEVEQVAGATITAASALSGGDIAQDHKIGGAALSSLATVSGGGIGGPTRALISWVEIEVTYASDQVAGATIVAASSLSGGAIGQDHKLGGAELTAASALSGGEIAQDHKLAGATLSAASSISGGAIGVVGTDQLEGGTITSQPTLSGGGVGQDHKVSGATLTSAASITGGSIGVAGKDQVQGATITVLATLAGGNLGQTHKIGGGNIVSITSLSGGFIGEPPATPAIRTVTVAAENRTAVATAETRTAIAA